MSSLLRRVAIYAGSAGALGTFLAQKGIGEYDLFTLHPILMMVAFLALMGEGIVHYRVSETTLTDARKRHRNIFIAVGVLSLSSIVVILRHKADINHAWTPHSAHAICGILTMCMVFFQGAVGMKKLAALLGSNGHVKIHRWHGAFGLATFSLAACTQILGFNEILGSWSSFSMVFATLSILAVVGTVWHTQCHAERTVVDATYGMVHERDDVDDIDDVNLFDTEPTDYA